jgi:hypothetical protein
MKTIVSTYLRTGTWQPCRLPLKRICPADHQALPKVPGKNFESFTQCAPNTTTWNERAREWMLCALDHKDLP